MPFPIRQINPADYPQLLKEIPNQPKVLYIRGTMPPADYKYLCVIGSRACSLYGRRMTQKLISGLSPYPVVVVSGMALGLDAEALKAALDVGLKTIAILPSSVDEDSIYPTTNRPLAKRILAQGGCLLSENKTPFIAMIHSFPSRDRLMAGIAHATLVTEAGEKSGTLITAKLALDYNREVLAIPHELEKETGRGVNRLLREGATLVRNSDDIRESLGLAAATLGTQVALPMDLTSSETKVLQALDGSLVRDELIERSALSAQDAGIALSSLLIRGLIVERLGKIERI